MLDSFRVVSLLTLLGSPLAACDHDGSAPALDGVVDAIDAPMGGKADGGCPAPDSAAAAGILDLVNDPQVTQAMLDGPVSGGGVGLDGRAARGIVQGRPFATFAELDAIPYVGPFACRALAERACNTDGRCQAPLRVVTWNLRHFPLAASTTTVVPQYIRDLDLDVIALQEVGDEDAFDELVDRLPGYSGFLAEPGPFTRVGLIVRDAAVEVQDVRSEFVDDGWAFPRPPLVVDVAVRGARQETTLSFVVVHLKASVDDRSRRRREQAVEHLRDYIDRQRSAGAPRILVLGDWNDALDDAPAWNVFGPLLADDARVSFLTEPVADDAVATLISFGTTIDHVMVTDEALDTMTGEHTEVLLLDEAWPAYLDEVSDHRPVLSTLGFARAYP